MNYEYIYSEDELEEIEFLKEEAEEVGVSLTLLIADGEPLPILRQVVESAVADKYNYSYGL